MSEAVVSGTHNAALNAAINLKRAAEMLRAKNAEDFRPPAVVLSVEMRDLLVTLLNECAHIFDEISMALEQDAQP